jgi:hypothetical protein
MVSGDCELWHVVVVAVFVVCVFVFVQEYVRTST